MGEALLGLHGGGQRLPRGAVRSTNITSCTRKYTATQGKVSDDDYELRKTYLRLRIEMNGGGGAFREWFSIDPLAKTIEYENASRLEAPSTLTMTNVVFAGQEVDADIAAHFWDSSYKVFRDIVFHLHVTIVADDIYTVPGGFKN